MRVLRHTLLFAASLGAADWKQFRAGPIEVWTNAGEKEARNTLATLDQLHWWTAKLLGKTELRPLWPVRVLVLKNDKTAAPYRTPRLELRRESYSGGMLANEPMPREWIRDFARILLNDDTAVMGLAIENGLIDTLSTLEAKSNMITAGAPPPPEKRTRDWARMHLLTTPEENTGRVRVFFSNLQQASPVDSAYRNAFGKGEREMEAEIDAYLKAGRFEPRQVSGKPISLERDYRPRPLNETRARVALADLLPAAASKAAHLAIVNAGEKNPGAFEGAGMLAEATQAGSENARAWNAYALSLKDVEKAKTALQKAMELAPRWAEPRLRFSERMVTEGRIAPLKKACELEPRNIAYWRLLAQAQVEFKDFGGALVSWRSAERAGATPEERAKIESMRRAYEQQKLDLEAAEKKRAEDEKQRELAQLKAEAEARVREAEVRANARLGKFESSEKPVEWWDGPKGAGSLQGSLERVDCLKGPARIAVRGAKGKLDQFLIANPSQIAITGGGEAALSCGPQKPARRVRVEFQPKQDAKLGTSGEVVALEFLDAR